jgi:hypothetical protein
MELITTLPVVSYLIYMDNYFSSVALFNHLYTQQYGACGIARSMNSIPPQLQKLKEHAKEIP